MHSQPSSPRVLTQGKVRGEGTLLGPFHKGMNPTQEEATLTTQSLPQAQSPKTITLQGSGFQHTSLRQTHSSFNNYISVWTI